MEEAGKEPEQKLFFMTAAPALPRKRYFRKKKKCIQTCWHHFPRQRFGDITGANVSDAETHSSLYILKDSGNLLGLGTLFPATALSL